MGQVEVCNREVNIEEDRHRKIKATYMTPQLCKPQADIPPIPIG